MTMSVFFRTPLGFDHSSAVWHCYLIVLKWIAVDLITRWSISEDQELSFPHITLGEEVGRGRHEFIEPLRPARVVRYVIWLSSYSFLEIWTWFYRWGNWIPERLSSFLKVTQLINEGAIIWASNSNPMFFGLLRATHSAARQLWLYLDLGPRL